MHKNIALVLIILALFFFPTYQHGLFSSDYIVQGTVLHTLPPIETEEGWKEEEVVIQIKRGEFEGETVTAINSLSGNPRYDLNLEEGKNVIISLDIENNIIQNVHIKDIGRHNHLAILGLIFIIALLLVGRRKGSHSLAALAITILLIIKVLLPLLLQGLNPLWTIIGVAIIIAASTLLIISGFNLKTLSSLIGIGGGLVIAGMLAYFFGRAAQLTGLASHETPLLQYIDGIQMDFEGLLFGAIVLGALGAIMDVAISVASGLEQVKLAQPQVSFQELYRAGISIGKDIMGTMINTLVLAYVGGTLPLMLLLLAEQPAFLELINMELIATELIRALAGSTGLVLAIPLTSAISSWFYGERLKVQ